MDTLENRLKDLSRTDRSMIENAKIAKQQRDDANDALARWVDRCISSGRITYGMLSVELGMLRENVYRIRKRYLDRVAR